MNIRKPFLTITSIALTLFALGCNAPPPQQLPDIESTVRARVGQVKEALIIPTPAPLPTQTPYPTFTPQPTLDLQATVEAIVNERLALVEAVATPSPEPPDTPTPRPVQTATPLPTHLATSKPIETDTPVQTSTPKSFRTYTHPAGYWKISYPEDWPNPESIFVNDANELTVISGPSSISIVIKQSFNKQLDDLYVHAASELREISKWTGVLEFEQFDLIQVTVGGHLAYQATYKLTFDSGTDIRTNIWLSSGSDVYDIQGGMPLEEAKIHFASVGEILNSFEPLTR